MCVCLKERERERERVVVEVVVETMGSSSAKKKLASALIRLVSEAGTGYFYVTRKNAKRTPQKLQLMKYDPLVRRHVLFTEKKMK